jgi:hypothetical protein
MMIDARYEALTYEARNWLETVSGNEIRKTEFDALVGAILSCDLPGVADKVYGRDGLGWVNQLKRNTFQIVALQINSFGPGIFGETEVKLCTPLLLTVTIPVRHRHPQRSLKETPLSVVDSYLGTHFRGSKGEQCDRDSFDRYLRELIVSSDHHRFFNHEIVYRVMNANYICHHVAETLGYGLAALDVFWRHEKGPVAMSAASKYDSEDAMLGIEIVEDFSSKTMASRFQVPHYAKLRQDPRRFTENHDVLVLDITLDGEEETFHLPVGYQREFSRHPKKKAMCITTQHILEHVLRDYYRRINGFVVASTFQTLEYLSRAFLARLEENAEESGAFLKTVTSCIGYNPDRNFEEFWSQREQRYTEFESEYAETMFFRPPVLD